VTSAATGIVATVESHGRTLVDSDVIIDHLRGARALPSFPLACSTITRCELFAGRDKPEVLRRLLKRMLELPVDSAIAERGGVLKRTCQLATPDALIAATALEHDLPLMTRNRRRFERVAGLELQTPPEPSAAAEQGADPPTTLS
jgi:predicted nucleic acid-binding protein